jgi:hypothetical protein
VPKQTFDNLLLIARPAAGKSEIINFLKHVPFGERVQRFHIGNMTELDDFPMLWTWKEEDSILARMGHPTLHFDSEGYFLEQYFWNVLIKRISLEYRKLLRDQPDFHAAGTAIIEFSRGREHGGYREAFRHLSKAIAQDLAIMYVNVSWEESLRKNRARYNPERPDSILEHGLSDEKMETLYREDDWAQITAEHPETIPIQGCQVPYVVFENEDDVTTPGGAPLETRLESTLHKLFGSYQQA